MDKSPPDHTRSSRGAGIATFMGLPHGRDLAGIDAAIVGIPSDNGGTPGSRWAPRMLRDVSSLLRPAHAWHRLAIFDEIAALDWGDVAVVPPSVERTHAAITAEIGTILDAGVVPIALGGDHGITLAELRAAARHGPVALVQFDAHTDTYDRYYGDFIYTSGTPFRRAVEEGIVDASRSVMVGLRGSIYAPTDYDDARDLGYLVITAEDVADIGAAETAERIRTRVGEALIFLTFDVDCLDPSCAPATGTLETGGLTTREAQSILRRLDGLNFAGFDVVEMNPAFEGARLTAVAAATMAFECLALIALGKRTRR